MPNQTATAAPRAHGAQQNKRKWVFEEHIQPPPKGAV
jgi:hypothetical protein